MAKVKVPKRIAGVKVPKKLRKQAKRLLKASQSAIVRELALAGLTLAAHRMLGERGTEGDSGAEADAGRRGKARAKGALHGLNLAVLLEAAAAEGARRFLAGHEPQPAAEAAPRRRPGAAPQG